MLMINITQTKKCALCTHWYDPSNACIKPKSPRIGIWMIDNQASCYCDVKRHEMKGGMLCSEFERKKL